MRFLAALMLIGASLLSTETACAGILDLSGSTFEIHYGNALTISVGQTADPVPVFVSSGNGSFTLPSGLFTHTGTLPPSLFTGVPLVSSMMLSLTNLSGTMTSGGGGSGGFGGVAGLTGGWALRIVGGCCFFSLTPLSPVGVGGTAPGGAAALMITVTGAPWTTGVAAVTGVTAPTGGGFTNTATLAGFDNRTASHVGSLRLVTPMRLLSNAGFPSTHFFVQNLVFVPEPETLFLTMASAAALVVMAWRRR